MKYFLLFYALIIAVVWVSATHFYSEDYLDKKTETVVGGKRTVTEKDIRKAFVNEPVHLKACEKIEEGIRGKREGYKDEKYRNYALANVSDTTSFQINREGDKVKVTLRCNFSVVYEFNRWQRSEEKYSYDGGVFHLTIHYNQDNNISGLSFD